MNENLTIRLQNYLISGEGWGRAAGEKVRGKLTLLIDAQGSPVVRISMGGVRKLDVSFAASGIVELVKHHLGSRSISLSDLDDPDIIENVAAAAQRLAVPVALSNRAGIHMLGATLSASVQAALAFALARPQVRAAEFAQAAGISSANASNKFKQLWQLGYLRRSESIAASGGTEFVYRRIE